jgi:hypothetical protein
MSSIATTWLPASSSSITVELAAMPEAKAKPRVPPSSEATQRS